jgi:hypothetical protein
LKNNDGNQNENGEGALEETGEQRKSHQAGNDIKTGQDNESEGDPAGLRSSNPDSGDRHERCDEQNIDEVNDSYGGKSVHPDGLQTQAYIAAIRNTAISTMEEKKVSANE